jgi:putative transposase
VNAIHAAFLSEGRSVPKKTICTTVGVPRSVAYYHPRKREKVVKLDPDLSAKIKSLIEAHPSRGIRFVWAQLRFAQGLKVTRKKVHRIMRERGWTVKQRKAGSRPRVPGPRSVADAPDQRWATDFALVNCGQDGWCVFAPVVDCCTREVLGWSLQLTGRTKTAELALEDALVNRFGWVRGAPLGLRLRRDNGLVFGSRAYRALVRDYGLTQEFIAPYTPEQNGLCERFIRTFKEECAWQHNFRDIEEARKVVATFIDFYNTQRHHQSLGFLTPVQFRKTMKEVA